MSFNPSLDVFSIDEIPFPVSPLSPFGLDTSIISPELLSPHEVTVPSKTAGNIETAKTFKNLFFILKHPLFYKATKQ